MKHGCWRGFLPVRRLPARSAWLKLSACRMGLSISIRARLSPRGFRRRAIFITTRSLRQRLVYIAAVPTVIAFAAIEDLELEAVDISTPPLNGGVDWEGFIKHYKGMEGDRGTFP